MGARNALVNNDREALVTADLVNFTESNTVELFKSLRKNDVRIPHKAENSFQTFRFLCHKWRTTGRPLDETVWSRTYPMRSKAETHFTLDEMFHQVGVPEALVVDNSKEQTKGLFARKARQAQCPVDTTDTYSPWQNRAESEIREVKRQATRWMLAKKSPKPLWCFCMELSSLVRSHTAHDLYQLKGQVPETVMYGMTADISHLCEFAWCDWVMAHNPVANFPEEKLFLARYLGPTRPGIGSVMSFNVIKANGEVIRTPHVRRLTPLEERDESHREERKSFTEALEAKLGQPFLDDEIKNEDTATVAVATPEYEPYSDEETEPILPIEADDYDPETYDSLVNAEVQLSHNDNMETGIVRRRKFLFFFGVFYYVLSCAT